MITKKKLLVNLQADELIRVLEEGIAALGHAFDEKDMCYAVKPVMDKKGEVFWEVVFKGLKQQSRPKSGLL